MKIEIEQNLLDKISFEKNYNLIHTKGLEAFNVSTVGTIGLSTSFNENEGQSNAGKIMLSASSKYEEQNVFKLTIERVLIFKFYKDNENEKIDVKNIIDELSKLKMHEVMDQAETILTDAGLSNIKLKKS